MEQVQIGLMLPGAKPFNDSNINPTFKSHVKMHGETVVAYVKIISPREIYIECVCAVIGRFLGLPIPKPIIVKVDHNGFSNIPEGNYQLAFGSEDSSYPSFRRCMNDNNEEALEKLKNFKHTIDIGVFDEWIGNADRHAGNILYDGSEEFVFIDHGLALGQQLGSETAVEKNIIIDTFYSVKSEFDKYKINREVQSTITPQYPELPYSLISEKTYATSYLTAKEVVNIVNLLEVRSKNINDLFKQRLRIKQQGLAI